MPGDGQLTPTGMRLRYLLGRYNRQKYVYQEKLLSKNFKPGEVYIQSTDYNRTLQSAYSEFLGLYPETV
jgi:hypothetical protein